MFTTAEQATGEVVVPVGASASVSVGPPEVARPVQAAPCAARPGTGFVHRDGRCRCFTGGPPPEFPAAVRPNRYRFGS